MNPAKSTKTLRVGVVGAGVFGGWHAGKYAAHPRVVFAGAYDSDAASATALAERFAAQAYPTLDTLLDDVEALAVATPATTHAQIAKAALEAGRHVLVEKPLAANIAEGEALLELAKDKDCILQVGHQERSVFEAIGLFDVEATPRRIVARRRGPYHGRGGDVGAAVDLMVHDIDLARRLAGGATARIVEAEGKNGRTKHLDLCRARVVFSNGMVGDFEASRLATARERVMRIEYDEGVVEIDFVGRAFLNETPFNLDSDFASDWRARDPLDASVDKFVRACLDGEPPAIAGEDGLEALRIALAAEAVARRTDHEAVAEEQDVKVRH